MLVPKHCLQNIFRMKMKRQLQQILKLGSSRNTELQLQFSSSFLLIQPTCFVPKSLCDAWFDADIPGHSSARQPSFQKCLYR